MDRKILFSVGKEDDTLFYVATTDFEAKDGLNVLATTVDFAIKVAQEMVGLTLEEAELNIYKAVDTTLKKAEIDAGIRKESED